MGCTTPRKPRENGAFGLESNAVIEDGGLGACSRDHASCGQYGEGEALHQFLSLESMLPGIDVQIAWDGNLMRPELPARTALLFPGDDAKDLAQMPAEERPEHLVVLDGTWPQARGLYRRNSWLQALASR